MSPQTGRSSLTLIQKYGVRGFLILSTIQRTPMFPRSTACSRYPDGRSGAMRRRNESGIVETTPSAEWSRPEARTPRTRESSRWNLSIGLAVNPPTLRGDGFDQRLHERVRTAFEKTQPLLEGAVSGAREPVNAAPDPGGGDGIGLVRELLAKERLPHHSIRFLPRPLEEPIARGNVLELLPLGPALRGEHVEPVAQARGRGERRESEKRERVAEGVQPLVAEDRHPRSTPAEPLREPEAIEPAEVDSIAAAEEVAELLGVDGAEIQQPCEDR